MYIAIAVATLFYGCGGGGGSSTSNTQTSTTTGVLVDPYIVGAVMCEDVNRNLTCDVGEQLSTATTSSGEFSFSSPLTSGSYIIIQQQGLHDGSTYDLELTAVYNGNSGFIVSPLTTLGQKGLTASQIADMFNKAASDAGISGFTLDSSVVFNDPLSGSLMSKKISEITDADLRAIQSSLASYMFLKVIKGSNALSAMSAADLYTSGMTTGQPVNMIMQTMLQSLTTTLNTTSLQTIKTTVDSARSTLAISVGATEANSVMPEPTVELIVKMAVSFGERLSTAGYSACNSSGGNVTTALSAVSSTLTSIGAQNGGSTANALAALGKRLYVMKYHQNLQNISNSGAKATLLTGLDAATADSWATNGKSAIRFDASGNMGSE